jgi:hypothetical protein
VLRSEHADAESFLVIYLCAGKVSAPGCVNGARHCAQGRKLIGKQAVVPPERLADPNVPLRYLGSKKCEHTPLAIVVKGGHVASIASEIPIDKAASVTWVGEPSSTRADFADLPRLNLRA